MKKNFKKILFLFFLVVSTMTISCQKKEIVKNYEETEKIDSETIETTQNTIETTEAVREVHEIIGEMNILGASGYRESDRSTYIEVEFSKDISDSFDGTSYIKIEPSINFTVSKYKNKFLLQGDIDSKQTYEITVLSGVKASDGTMTKSDKTYEIKFTQKKPKIDFTNEGIILPSVNEKKVYIRSLNVNRVNIIVRKVYSNNLTQFLQNFDFVGNGVYKGSFVKDDDKKVENDYDDDYYYDDYYYDDYYYYEKSYNEVSSFYNVGDEIYNVYFDIENEIDTWTQSQIDLTGVLDSNGMYMINVFYDEKGTSYKFSDSYEATYYIAKNGIINKTILLTDIGIMAQKNEEGFHVNVLDIVENRPLRGIKTYLMSKNNQILESKTTDADGIVNFSNNKNAFYILADNSQSKSILTLKNSLSTNGFSVDGEFATNGIKGFIYTERGVYRPGDTIYTSIIARNNNEELENNQPINITVFDPTGAKMIENDVIKDGKNGFYTYTFKTDVSSRTGLWKLEATIGDKVFSKEISVEAVVPNNIKVNLDIPDVVNVNEEIDNWSISSNYLFGEPCGNLDYGVSFTIREEPIDFIKYKEYTFKAPSSYGYSEDKNLHGTLDSNGYAKIVPRLNDLEFNSVNLLMDVSGRVTDDSGRNIISKKYSKLKKFDTYIGIENTNTYKRPGSKLNLKAICVTSDGESLVAGKKLTYRIYGNNRYWWWDYSNYDRFVRSFKSDKNTTLLYEGKFITKDVPTLLEDELPNAEYIYVEIEDETTGQITGVNLLSSEWIDSTVTKKVETLNVMTDKKKYTPGEIAKISFKGTDSAKAIITIEKAGEIINQYYRTVNENEVIENIEITKNMAPNVYVYVTLLQNYSKKDNDRPLRLYGLVPLIVEDEDTKIDLQITAPEQIRPNEKFVVNVKNKKNKKVDFTIAVVDEGLLDITAFKTPNPWNHFFKKIAANLMLYDNYSEIIDKPYGAINQILKVGGDESLADEMARRRRLKELGLEEAERFTPVSMFKGVLTTDGRGEANVEFEMPNYMGAVRIMVIAADGNSYGSSEKSMIVKAPLIVKPNLPRSMKVGDKLNLSVSVFALEEGLGNVQVYYAFKGKVQTKNLNMKKGSKEIVYFEEEIGNEVSSEKLIIGANSNLYNYEETVSIAINSNNNPIEISDNKELRSNEEAVFLQNKQFVKGTVESILTISNKIQFGIDQRLKYLIRYPYGCIEQTTSSIFPQLFIEKLSTIKNYDMGAIVKNINAGIDRLKLFQLSDGSFSYWPGGNSTAEWATNYVGHFLISAKNNGYYVPESLYNGWLNYTMKYVRGTTLRYETDVDRKCYSLYLLALAGKANISEMNYMFENYFNNKMTDTSKMYLAAAYKLVGESDIALNFSYNINLNSIKKMFDDIYSKNSNYYDYSYGSRLREMSVYLDCYNTIYGKLDMEAFNEILNAMRKGEWYSTQTTAYALLALSNAVKENMSDTINGVIEIDGIRTDFTTSDEYKMVLSENSKSIKVTNGSSGMAYVNYFWEGVPIDEDTSDYSNGFTIKRNFYNNEGEAFNETSVKSGETFWLEVVIEPTSKNISRVENIALTQILPSGWEIENLRLTNTNTPKWIDEKPNKANVSYTDIRDDRVMWFFDHTRNKEYRFYVKINAVSKGEFDFPGTNLEAMYDNNYRAYKKGYRVKVN